MIPHKLLAMTTTSLQQQWMTQIKDGDNYDVTDIITSKIVYQKRDGRKKLHVIDSIEIFRSSLDFI